ARSPQPRITTNPGRSNAKRVRRPKYKLAYCGSRKPAWTSHRRVRDESLDEAGSSLVAGFSTASTIAATLGRGAGAATGSPSMWRSRVPTPDAGINHAAPSAKTPSASISPTTINKISAFMALDPDLHDAVQQK